MGRPRFALIAFPLLVALSACSGTSTPSTAAGAPTAAAPVVNPTVAAPVVNPTAVSTPSATATESPAASTPAPPSEAPAGSEGPTAAPTALDPCQVVTSEEASTLAGVSFGAGKESTTKGNAKICTYGAATPNVFTVFVAQAPDAAAAQAAKSQVLATLNSALGKGVKVTSVPGLADSAAVLSATESAGGTAVAASGIYLLKGLDFLAFSDVALGKPAPTEAALEAQASTSLGRLP